jgi:hypothetical protein
MSAVVLDASATTAQAPAVYAETLLCGAGGVIAATDPAVGVQISRNYGALGAQTELLMNITKDLGLPPSAIPNWAGGTLQVAGIAFQGAQVVNTIGPNPQNAGNYVAGYSPLIAGEAIITANAVFQFSSVYRSIIMCQRAGTGLPALVNGGPLVVEIVSPTPPAVNATEFHVRSLNATDGLLNITDTGYFTWIIFNPSWTQ